MRALILFALLGGCFKVDIVDGKLQCSVDTHECPRGYTCDPDDICRKSGEVVDLAGVDLAVDMHATVADFATNDGPAFDLSGPKGDAGNGTQCMMGSDCATGACVDGYCCDTVCGTCTACNVKGKEGTCTPVAAGAMDPVGVCVDDLKSCTKATCDGQGACAAYPAGTVCDASCDEQDVNGQYSSVVVTMNCDGSSGSGSCTGNTLTMCNPYLCMAGSTGVDCTATCMRDADCSQEYFCNASGACTARVGLGGGCPEGNHECTSFICESGTCADCDTDLQCPPPKTLCSNHVCAIGCGTTSPLIYGSSCVSKMEECAMSSDCKQGYAPICSASLCTCTGTAACAVGQLCISGACLVEPNFPCVKNSDCASGMCVSGLCTQMKTGDPCAAWSNGFATTYQDCATGTICCNGTCKAACP